MADYNNESGRKCSILYAIRIFVTKYVKEKIVNNFVSVTLLTMVFSMLIETAQLVLKVGAFDVDDIFLNTVGGLLGYIVLKIMKLFMKNRNK